MTASDPREAAPDARPEGDKQRQEAASRELQDRTGGRPKFVIEIWASPQLRKQNPGRALSLSEALGRQPAARRDRELDPEPEIEP
jgi:hypothetical protein